MSKFTWIILIVQAIFVVLKLANVITEDWWIVFAPVYAGAFFYLANVSFNSFLNKK